MSPLSRDVCAALESAGLRSRSGPQRCRTQYDPSANRTAVYVEPFDLATMFEVIAALEAESFFVEYEPGWAACYASRQQELFGASMSTILLPTTPGAVAATEGQPLEELPPRLRKPPALRLVKGN